MPRPCKQKTFYDEAKPENTRTTWEMVIPPTKFVGCLFPTHYNYDPTPSISSLLNPKISETRTAKIRKAISARYVPDSVYVSTMIRAAQNMVSNKERKKKMTIKKFQRLGIDPQKWPNLVFDLEEAVDEAMNNFAHVLQDQMDKLENPNSPLYPDGPTDNTLRRRSLKLARMAREAEVQRQRVAKEVEIEAQRLRKMLMAQRQAKVEAETTRLRKVLQGQQQAAQGPLTNEDR
ncbi:hypothetical protein G9A89_022439 [Geosiphon pyriformis]|nr:hypothetical protein G9A89_022439 [Geosiphon pyriformis]